MTGGGIFLTGLYNKSSTTSFQYQVRTQEDVSVEESDQVAVWESGVVVDLDLDSSRRLGSRTLGEGVGEAQKYNTIDSIVPGK